MKEFISNHMLTLIPYVFCAYVALINSVNVNCGLKRKPNLLQRYTSTPDHLNSILLVLKSFQQPSLQSEHETWL
jgi:hypothetical protein